LGSSATWVADFVFFQPIIDFMHKRKTSLLSKAQKVWNVTAMNICAVGTLPKELWQIMWRSEATR